MHIALVGLLKRGVSSSFLKQLWSPPLLCQSGEHGVAKDVWRDRNARAGSEPPKERVYICIGERLACTCALAFDEHMGGFHLGGVCDPNVGHNLVAEIC